MADQSRIPLGQNENAARTHRLLAWLFAALVGVVLYFFPGSLDFSYVATLLFYAALAIGNYQIAKGAHLKRAWAKVASIVAAVLLLFVGVVLFFNGRLVGIFGCVFFIAGIYILLNSNWRQPVPPDERPDSSTRP